ncbi:MAG: 3-hydroxy-3-methylglutaryl CoA synthase, partial [Myxococcota bacterium]
MLLADAVAILEVGVAVPRARLARKTIAEATGAGRAPAGERAVANHDEDPVTLMVEAALAAAGDGLPGVDLVVCATTSAPCVEKSSAALVVEACDGGAGVATIDLAGSRRCGLEALW